MTNGEKDAYTNAVLCLTRKPSNGIYPDAPGVITRYDDFVATRESPPPPPMKPARPPRRFSMLCLF